jgi:hypothetical protein
MVRVAGFALSLVGKMNGGAVSALLLASQTLRRNALNRLRLKTLTRNFSQIRCRTVACLQLHTVVCYTPPHCVPYCLAAPPSPQSGEEMYSAKRSDGHETAEPN